MKIVGFKALRKTKKKNKIIIISWTNVFKKLVIPMGVLLFILTLNLVANTFLKDVADSISKFVETFANI